ncbi:hypothetical protein ALC53_05854 [Atta colombica]|uniref:Secreted protein n=1 Tax=Atta colombica TaxID=520822 RepID=A0A151I3M4_9HYME|nr:hypothetical protein ALC53_05854 [Atta colombica]
MNTQPIVITAISVLLTINVAQRINICFVIDANIRRASLKLSELWITHSINWDTLYGLNHSTISRCRACTWRFVFSFTDVCIRMQIESLLLNIDYERVLK